MPGGDGTGPWWVQGRSWRCFRGRGYYWRRFYPDDPAFEPVMLTKDEQKKTYESLIC